MSLLFKIIDNVRRIMRARDADVLIYQMGKVGSSTLYRSVPGSCQLHTLSGEVSRKYSVGFYQKSLLKFFLGNLRWAVIVFFLKKNMASRREKMKVITMVRDPIARNISAFFQNLEESVHGEMSSNELVRLFWVTGTHLAPLYWFDAELKGYLDIDVTKCAFDQENGRGVVSNNQFDVLVIRLENLKKNESFIAEFIGDEGFRLQDSNVSSKKWYSSKYKEFLASFSPSDEYMDLMYKGGWVENFYSQAEIVAFRNKWKGGGL